MTKFEVGDVVELQTKEKGVIKSVEMVLGEGNNLYLVTIKDHDLMYSENLLTLVEKANNLKQSQEIDKIVKQIIQELSLVNKPNAEDALRNACKLQKYMVFREIPITISDIKSNDIEMNELYEGLVNGREDYVTNAYVFSYILSEIGMDVCNVGLKDENDDFYMANLVLIGEEYYYFDSTLEKEIYEEEEEDEKVPFSLCCAALGKKSYESFFTPVVVFSFQKKGKNGLVPKNIALEDISMEKVNEGLE